MGEIMDYSLEILKIIEGAFKRDDQKVLNYTKMLADKLEQDGDTRNSKRFRSIITAHSEKSLNAMSIDSLNKTMPVDNESRMMLGDIIYPDDNVEEVVLTIKNQEDIEEFLLNYESSDKLFSSGVGLANTLLLYGPPGCGKTKCAYMIAKKLNLPLVIARLDSLISSYLGTTAKNIRTLFDYTQKFPCVLFLDEFDAIAKARDDNNELGELKRVVNSLLQNVDMMSKESLLIAATNHENLLDPAVWRRFEYKLEIGLPDAQSISKMIKAFSGNSYNLSDKETIELSMLMQGLSGSDIEMIIKKATRNSIVHSTNFSVYSIYEEFFKYKNIIPQNCENSKYELSLKALYLRKIDSKVFSLQVIADILGSSKTTISKIIKEDSN